MNREAAVLGTPVWSMFEGRLGAVDELLVHQGRLRLLRDPDDIVVTRKGPTAVPTLRDPGELLALRPPVDPMSSFEPFDSRGYRTVDAPDGLRRVGAHVRGHRAGRHGRRAARRPDRARRQSARRSPTSAAGAGAPARGWPRTARRPSTAPTSRPRCSRWPAPGASSARWSRRTSPTPACRAASYDVVTTSLVDEHLADLRPLYAEAARLLRPGGTYAIVGFHPHFIMASGMPTHFDDADGEPVAIVDPRAPALRPGRRGARGGPAARRAARAARSTTPGSR